MLFGIRIPHPPLSFLVENLWFYEGVTVSHKMERLLPDGAIELIIDLTETPKHIYSSTNLQEIQTCRQGWISGHKLLPSWNRRGGCVQSRKIDNKRTYSELSPKTEFVELAVFEVSPEDAFGGSGGLTKVFAMIFGRFDVIDSSFGRAHDGQLLQ